MNLLRLAILGFALVLPSVAFAQNASTPGTLSLYPTFESIGARLAYTGDANGNATARLEWRRAGDPSWAPGMAMSRITNSRWAGSVLWLLAGTAYEVRVVLEDPDGGGTSSTASTTTRTTLPATATGPTVWVATNGSDSNDGSSGAPLATLNAAASRVVAGGEIRVRPGIYYQSFDTPKAGTAAAPIHLVADGPGVILDGSDPALLSTTWRSDGSGIYSIAYTPTTNRLVCADSLMRLYKHSSLSALQTNANGMTQGFAISGGRLYVKLDDGSDPTNHKMHIARYNIGMTIDQNYWHVTGFDVRYFGTTAASGAGVYLSATGGWFAGNHVYTLGGRGVFIRSGSSDNLVENNLITDPRVGVWPWTATKGHDEEITGISNRGGRGHVIRNNTVRGFFDGLDANVGDSDENIAADADYHGNVVAECGDDAIETDTVSGINLRIWGNTFTDNYSGFSIGPIYQGPEYVLYNVIANYERSGFKFALSTTGQAWLCHNTLTSNVSGTPCVWPSGPWSNIHFRNNVLVGNNMPTVNDDSGESQTGNDFDGDQLYSTGSTLFRWKNTNYSSLSSLRSATGFETSGRSGNPLFVSTSTGDYRLQAGSPAIDAGLLLPGINSGRYNGAAPDAGAFETGTATVDTIPPATINDLR